MYYIYRERGECASGRTYKIDATRKKRIRFFGGGGGQSRRYRRQQHDTSGRYWTLAKAFRRDVSPIAASTFEVSSFGRVAGIILIFMITCARARALSRDRTRDYIMCIPIIVIYVSVEDNFAGDQSFGRLLYSISVMCAHVILIGRGFGGGGVTAR